MKKVSMDSLGPVTIAVFIIIISSIFYYEVFIEERAGVSEIGHVENITLVANGRSYPITAKMDTGADLSSIDESLARELGIDKDIVGTATIKSGLGVEVRKKIKVPFYIGGTLVEAEMTLSNRSNVKYPVLIGRNGLYGFAVNPNKEFLLSSSSNTFSFGLTLSDKSMRFIFIIAILSIIIVFFRQIIGLRTYGTFAPLIISLSFLHAGFVSGIGFYAAVLVSGIAIDRLFGRFNMLLASRISVNLHVLALVTVFIFMVMGRFSNEIFIIGIPFIVLTHIIESFNTVAENSSAKEAAKLLFNTFFVASVSFIIGEKVFELADPLQLAAIFAASFAGTFLMSFYSGVRVLEFTRFLKGKGHPVSLKPFFDHPFLGMNYRNKKLITECNPQEAIKLVNDKIAFKRVLMKKGIPTTEMLAEISKASRIGKVLDSVDAPFVIKPARGLAGNGILIVDRVERGIYYTNEKRRMKRKDIIAHIKKIIEGQYSMGLESDTALIERRLTPDRRLAFLSPDGLSDVRVIVFKGTPIAAMMRIPTKTSEGKANLSLGALGAHIDIETGRIISIYDKISKKKTYDIPPHFKIRLPHWEKVLEISVRATEAAGLGFSGVDIVYDESGPLVMECNARPGLEIQNVIGKSLLDLIKEIKAGNAPKMRNGLSSFFGPSGL